MVTTYFGLTWWDNEIDGDKLYPKEQRNPTEEQRFQSFERNPEGAAVRGLWSDEKFLENVGGLEFNKQLKTTQFADFHGHGWISALCLITTAKGTGSTKTASRSPSMIPTALAKPFTSPISISKKGCSATIVTSLRTITATEKSTVAPRCDRNRLHRLPWHDSKESLVGHVRPGSTKRRRPSRRAQDSLGLRRFEWRDGKLFQRSMSGENKEWEVVQTIDTVTPGNVHFNEKSLRAKLMNKDGVVSSQVPATTLLSRTPTAA